MASAVRDPATWISRWAAAYHRPDDDPLAPLQGKAVLDASDRELLARWKFQSFPSRLQRTLDLLAGNDPRWADDLTRRAVACNDDLGAWLIAQHILGVGPALASAMLMAHDPERFTVIDARAYRSVVLLAQTGVLTGNGIDPTRLIERARFSAAGTWLAYLHACRALATAVGCSLRDLDRALFAAKGRAGLPAA
jgi:hypothetical protein